MKTKWFTIALAVIITTVFGVANPQAAETPKVTKWVFSTNVVPGAFNYRFQAKHLANLIKERTGGQVELQITTELLKASETLYAIRDGRVPIGFVIHPYFSAPLSKSSSPENCEIILPARKYWELEEFLPTGRILEVSGKYDLINGGPMSGMKFDDVFTDLIMTDGVSRCIIDDKDAKMRMILESDPIYREMVIYTPPRGGAICFEPYTCPTDAINLHQRGMDVGLITLEPGESVSATVKVIFERYL